MDRISDENLNAMINHAAYLAEWNKSKGQDSAAANYQEQHEALKELKERRAADSKKLDIKAQLRLVRDRCPDLWKSILAEKCPDDFGFDNISAEDCSGCSLQCKECFNKALEGDN